MLIPFQKSLLQENFLREQSTFKIKKKLPNFILSFRTCSILPAFVAQWANALGAAVQ